MNIAAYMAALTIDDLDHSAKHAVQVVAGRANRRSGVAWLSIGRVAADMGVSYETARRALLHAVEAGHLAVDKSPNARARWTVTTLRTREGPPPQNEENYPQNCVQLPSPWGTKESKGVRRKGSRSPALPPGERARSDEEGTSPPVAPTPPSAEAKAAMADQVAKAKAQLSAARNGSRR